MKSIKNCTSQIRKCGTTRQSTRNQWKALHVLNQSEIRRLKKKISKSDRIGNRKQSCES